MFTDAALYPWFAKLPKVQVPEVLSRDVAGDVVRMRIRYRFGGDVNGAVRSVIDPAKLSWVDESEHDLAGTRSPSPSAPTTTTASSPDPATTGSSTSTAAVDARRDIDIKVSFPLVGRAVEKAIASGLREHLADEVRIVEAFLAGSG